jgi:hypothetical protein
MCQTTEHNPTICQNPTSSQRAEASREGARRSARIAPYLGSHPLYKASALKTVFAPRTVGGMEDVNCPQDLALGQQTEIIWKE